MMLISPEEASARLLMAAGIASPAPSALALFRKERRFTPPRLPSFCIIFPWFCRAVGFYLAPDLAQPPLTAGFSGLAGE
ncbi:hypothetical protein [Breoghania sp.]|uniref:hypothetical protein n=1 Tax=Breoghania sp. TaxID=2065378 RepID=UPI002AA8B75F|nr:hypothetical protein [Breoghania sp.]